MQDRITAYFTTLRDAALGAAVTDAAGKAMSLAEGFQWAIRAAREAHDAGNKLMFVGNGGSAGIASHMAIDYSKNGNIRALAFNDASALTCLGNDLGYENVFSHQIGLHGRAGDLLLAISSSGRSENILRAAKEARRIGCAIVTMSGFTPDNPLRGLGDVNFFVDAAEYGFVEIGHLALCHGILDMAMGWSAQTPVRLATTK